jgi:hypothetical protein
VRIGAAVGIRGGGSGDTGVVATTDADGQFVLNLPLHHAPAPRELSLIVTKDGYASFDSPRLPVPNAPAPAVNAGELTLEAGHSAAVRVVDADGHPLAGAVVEPMGSYASRRQLIRTDAQGRGVLRNLPPGPISVHATHGQLSLQSRLEIGTAANAPEVTLTLAEPPAP